MREPIELRDLGRMESLITDQFMRRMDRLVMEVPAGGLLADAELRYERTAATAAAEEVLAEIGMVRARYMWGF